MSDNSRRSGLPARVLLNSPWFTDPSYPPLKPLHDAGFDVVLNQTGRMFTEDELIERLPGAIATIAHGERYTERVFASTRDLRVVARFGVGYEKVDVASATRHGVAVALAIGANSESVADFAMGLSLALACNLFVYHAGVAGGRWPVGDHRGLWGGTAGIIGFGRIGKAMARRCLAHQMRVLTYDPAIGMEDARQAGAELVPLDELLAQADLVSLHVPLSEQTKGLISVRELSLMKRTAYLVNTARGGLVNEEALVDALKENRIAGAGLDVFEREPLGNSPLCGLKNVLLAPHAAGSDQRGKQRLIERCVASILDISKGRDPGGGIILNPEAMAVRKRLTV